MRIEPPHLNANLLLDCTRKAIETSFQLKSLIDKFGNQQIKNKWNVKRVASASTTSRMFAVQVLVSQGELYKSVFQTNQKKN